MAGRGQRPRASAVLVVAQGTRAILDFLMDRPGELAGMHVIAGQICDGAPVRRRRATGVLSPGASPPSDRP